MNAMNSSIREAVLEVGNTLMKVYWGRLYQCLKRYPDFIETIPGFLVAPEKVILYIGRTHLGVEYVGPERIEVLPESTPVEFRVFDFSDPNKNFLEQIIGFVYEDATSGIHLPLPPFTENLILPTNAGMDKLIELGWNFDAQPGIIGINGLAPELLRGQFTRIVNGLFFDADESGLKTRRVKWVDFIPITYEDVDEEFACINISFEMYNDELIRHDCTYVYPMPTDFKLSKLQKVNRFIELIGSSATSETEITQFLSQADHQFILSMKFGVVDVYAELPCEWQSENRKGIRPDFFIVRPDGYADIVEFKLPFLKGKTIVGTPNRQSMSAIINSYISQTRTYRDYFEDPNNRRWFEEKYGFKVYRPRRILVIGRRWDFASAEWKAIVSDYQDLEIITYDDLIDGVIAQFYM